MSPAPIKIRPLRVQDLTPDRVAEVNRLDSILSTNGGNITHKHLVRVLNSGFCTIFGAFHDCDDRLVGMVAAVEIPQPHWPNLWELHDLVVLQEYQHNGIGELLARAVILFAQRQGAAKLDLTTGYNRGLIGFYIRLGWQRRDLAPGVDLPVDWQGESVYMRMSPQGQQVPTHTAAQIELPS